MHNIFSSTRKKKLQELIKKENKSKKKNLTDNNLLIVQNLWPTHYQVLSIYLLKEFKKINVNMDMMIKNVKLVELNTEIATVFLKTQTLKII